MTLVTGLLVLLLGAAAPAAVDAQAATAQSNSNAQYSASSANRASASSYSSSSSSSATRNTAFFPFPDAAAAPPPHPAAATACSTVTQTSSTSCAGPTCCAVKQRVTLCPSHTTALAEINGARGACCIVLRRKHSGVPAAFCATPSALPGAWRFPAGVAVTLAPDCTTTPEGAPAGVLSCSATFAKLPRGYALLPFHMDDRTRGKAVGMTAGKAAPWVAVNASSSAASSSNTGSAGATAGSSSQRAASSAQAPVLLSPCGHASYSKFTQVAEWVKDGPTTFTVTCSP
jgi:hypothetical protein